MINYDYFKLVQEFEKSGTFLENIPLRPGGKVDPYRSAPKVPIFLDVEYSITVLSVYFMYRFRFYKKEAVIFSNIAHYT